MTYGERNGIWHVLSDGAALCGAEIDEATELDFEPRPLCWRCKERRGRVSGKDAPTHVSGTARYGRILMVEGKAKTGREGDRSRSCLVSDEVTRLTTSPAQPPGEQSGGTGEHPDRTPWGKGHMPPKFIAGGPTERRSKGQLPGMSSASD